MLDFEIWYEECEGAISWLGESDKHIDVHDRCSRKKWILDDMERPNNLINCNGLIIKIC